MNIKHDILKVIDSIEGYGGNVTRGSIRRKKNNGACCILGVYSEKYIEELFRLSSLMSKYDIIFSHMKDNLNLISERDDLDLIYQIWDEWYLDSQGDSSVAKDLNDVLPEFKNYIENEHVFTTNERE